MHPYFIEQLGKERQRDLLTRAASRQRIVEATTRVAPAALPALIPLSTRVEQAGADCALPIAS